MPDRLLATLAVCKTANRVLYRQAALLWQLARCTVATGYGLGKVTSADQDQGSRQLLHAYSVRRTHVLLVYCTFTRSSVIGLDRSIDGFYSLFKIVGKDFVMFG
jgi:hypothetical protein